MIIVYKIPAWYWKSIGVRNYCVNDRGPLVPNLWALWGNDIQLLLFFLSFQSIALEVKCQSTCYIAVIYASTS